MRLRAVAVAGVLLISGCASTSTAFDRSALRDKAALVELRAPRHLGPEPWPFRDAGSFERLTRPRTPLTPARRNLTRHRRSRPGLIQEELGFWSSVRVGHPESNRAVAYLYRHGELGPRPLVIFAPGLYVSEAAMTPVGWLIDRILDQGADVLFYVPPYHLARTPRGYESGDAFLATSLPDHLAAIAQGVADLRALAAWLQGQGVRSLGAFGGSMGASMLLQVARIDRPFSFFTGMIPLVRWDDLLLGPPEFEPVRRVVLAQGYDLRALAALYQILDPSRVPPPLPPERCSVLYAAHDQVARAGPQEAWFQAWGLTRTIGYHRGHATILLTPALYDDYSTLLAEDLAAIGSFRGSSIEGAAGRP